MERNIIPIQQEITNTKRQIDDIEWEGGSCEHLHKHLDSLVDCCCIQCPAGP